MDTEIFMGLITILLEYIFAITRSKGNHSKTNKGKPMEATASLGPENHGQRLCGIN